MSLISILEDIDQDRNVPATNCQVHIQENDNDDDEAEKHGKQRSDVTLPSWETKAKCPYCTDMYKFLKTGSTTTLKRHLASCKKRARAKKGQKGIHLESILEEKTTITVTNFKYGKERSRNVLAMIIIVD